MLKHNIDASPAAVLAKPDNLVTACEIYRECGKADPRSSLNDPVAELLAEPEYGNLVGIIREEFPKALRWLTNEMFFKAVWDEIRKQLQLDRKWKLEPDPHYRWPSIYVMPRGRVGWGFCFSIDTAKVPFPLSHGIIFSENGGQPKSMSKALQSEVSQMEEELKKAGFTVKRRPENGWFGEKSENYEGYFLGENPSLLADMFTGKLAELISQEFITLFREWAFTVGRLNSFLKKNR